MKKTIFFLVIGLFFLCSCPSPPKGLEGKIAKSKCEIKDKKSTSKSEESTYYDRS